MEKNKKVIYNTSNLPCGTIKATLHSKVGISHTRYIKRATLERQG